MKITFYHFYTFKMGRGIETLILSLANQLVKNGHEITILSGSKEIETLVIPDKAIKVITTPKFRYFEHWFALPFFIWNLFKIKSDYTVIFFADFGEQYTLPLVNLFKKHKLIIYLCYPFSSVPHRYVNFAKKNIFKNAHKIIADAKWIADEAEPIFKRDINTVPVGTNPERFKPNIVNREIMRNKFSISKDSFVLLNVSSLEQRKGVWRVIEALNILEDPQIIYVILGKGEEEENLKKKVYSYNLEKQVMFLGTTTTLELYYQMADVFVMVPDLEGNSIASHEAMSSELPLIVSNTGGFPEAVPADGAEFVNPDNIDELVSAISKLKKDEISRKLMGAINRNHVIQNYGWESISKQFLKEIE